MKFKHFKQILIMILITIVVIFYLSCIMEPKKAVEAKPRTITLNIEKVYAEDIDLEDPKWVEPIIPADDKSWTIPNDVYILAHVLNGEAGSNWCSDEMIYGVGSVVLNRVKDKRFPDTIEGVVFQKGQYACTWDGNYDREPSQRCWDIAWDLYENGTTWPDNVIFQAQFEQGTGVYKKIQNMYFCWKN